METFESTRTREPYSKPEIQEVQLRIQEAVLAAGCKSIQLTVVQGFTGFGQSCPTAISPCFESNNLGS